MENRRDAQLFALHEEVSETKSILVHIDETIKEIKCTWRIRQKYFASFSLYADRHALEPISTTLQPVKQK